MLSSVNGLANTRESLKSLKHPRSRYRVGAGVGAVEGAGLGAAGVMYNSKAYDPPHVAELSPAQGTVHDVDVPYLSNSVPAAPHQH